MVSLTRLGREQMTEANGAEGAAEAYAKGVRYLSAARKVTAVAKRLDFADAEAVRRLGDRLTDRGLRYLTSAVRPRGGKAPRPTDGGGEH
jgi:hypothetical protein